MTTKPLPLSPPQNHSLDPQAIATPSHTFPPLPANQHGVAVNPHQTRPSTSSMTSLVNPATLALSLPHPPTAPTLIDWQAFQLLMAELPNSLRESTRYSRMSSRRAMLAWKGDINLDVGDAPLPHSGPGKEDKDGTTEEDRELLSRLESVGVHVGANLAEQVSRDRPPFTSTLDILKFVCKEIWTTIWEKQVDNLRTNHRGVYVLQDNHFKPIRRVTNVEGSEATIASAKIQLAYPCGIIRGALSRLGVPSSVVAETSGVPQCTFHVKTNQRS